MKEAMMAAAQEEQVGDFCGSAVCPMLDVVAVGPGRRHIAPREAAVFVASNQRPLHRWRYDPAAARDLDLV